MADRPLNVLFLTVGDEASPGTRLRALAYRPFLEARGHRVEIRFPLGGNPNRRRRRRVLRPMELARDLAAAARADVVVVYRKTFPGATARLLRRLASRIVFEYDDAVFLPSPNEPQDAGTMERYRRNFETTTAAADLVVAGNRHLAGKARHQRVEVLPTGVDLSVFRPVSQPVAGDGCVLGWIGTAGNLPQWARLVPVFERVVAEDPTVRFKVVSNGKPPRCDLPLEFEKFSIEREAVCLEDFHIGLMPLEETPWNRGKCSYKALQCMAMGQPVVLSPVGMNREVVEDGVSGCFAATDDEWVDRLLRLAGDPRSRAKMGEAARTVVSGRYSLERIGSRMADLIETLAD